MKSLDLNKFFLILTIAFITAILAILPIIIGFAKTPEGYVYLWTGHYYIDYFVYLEEIVQGMQGRWIVTNFYATDDPYINLHTWPHVLIGKIAWLFHFSPIFAYWLAVVMLIILLVVFAYKSIYSIFRGESFYLSVSALLLAIFTTPLFKLERVFNEFRVVPYDFWYGYGKYYERFRGVPYHLLSFLLILITMLFVAKVIKEIDKTSLKKIIIRSLTAAFIMIITLSFAPFNIIILLVAIALTSGLYIFAFFLNHAKRKYLKYLVVFLLIIVIFVSLSALILKSIYSQTAHFSELSNLEKNWQQYLPLSLILLNIGALTAFLPFGLTNFVKNISPYRVIFFIYALVSYVFFTSPFAYYLGTHNARFLSPLNYIAIATIAVLGIRSIARFIKLSEKKFVIVITSLILLVSLPVHVTYFKNRLIDPSIFTEISYLPKEVFEGFKFLGLYTDNKAVLTSSTKYLGVVLPIFANKHVYIAYASTTPNFIEKTALVDYFYRGDMPTNEAKVFLAQNNIGYVVLTTFEGYPADILKQYPFLKLIYKNSKMLIYKVKNS